MKTPHEYAKTTEHRSRQGMRTTENQIAPHGQKEGPRSWTEPHSAGATPTYPLPDSGTPRKYAQKKEPRSRQGTKMMESPNTPYLWRLAGESDMVLSVTI